MSPSPETMVSFPVAPRFDISTIGQAIERKTRRVGKDLATVTQHDGHAMTHGQAVGPVAQNGTHIPVGCGETVVTIA